MKITETQKFFKPKQKKSIALRYSMEEKLYNWGKNIIRIWIIKLNKKKKKKTFKTSWPNRKLLNWITQTTSRLQFGWDWCQEQILKIIWRILKSIRFQPRGTNAIIKYNQSVGARDFMIEDFFYLLHNI